MSAVDGFQMETRFRGPDAESATGTKRMGFLLAVLALVCAAGVLDDPYTFRYNASDYHVAAPFWQTGLALAGVALLAAAAGLVIAGRAGVAFTVAAAEAAPHLAVTAGLVWRDGLNRFARGYTGEEYLFVFLLYLLVRVLLLWGLGRLARVSARRNSEARDAFVLSG